MACLAGRPKNAIVQMQWPAENRGDRLCLNRWEAAACSVERRPGTGWSAPLREGGLRMH